MSRQKLKQEIRRRLSRALKIWTKAVRIAETFGKKRVKEHDWHTNVDYDFLLPWGNISLAIHKSSYVMGGDYIRIKANERLVFDADCTSNPKENEKLTVIAFPPKDDLWLRVKYFQSGDWEKAINFKVVKSFISREKKEHAKNMKLRKEEEKRRPPTPEEQEIARKLGIKTN